MSQFVVSLGAVYKDRYGGIVLNSAAKGSAGSRPLALKRAFMALDKKIKSEDALDVATIHMVARISNVDRAKKFTMDERRHISKSGAF